MAELTIKLQIDPASGKKNVIISYRSDDDALPLEHEDEHRNLVDKLIEGGAIAAGELGKVIIEREQPEGEASETGTAAAQQERAAIEQDS